MSVQFNNKMENKFTFVNLFALNQEWAVFVDSFHNALIVSTPKIKVNLMNNQVVKIKIKKLKRKVVSEKCKWVNR